MRPSTSYNKAVIKRTSFFIAVCLAAVLSSISVGVNAQIYTTTLPVSGEGRVLFRLLVVGCFWLLAFFFFSIWILVFAGFSGRS